MNEVYFRSRCQSPRCAQVVELAAVAVVLSRTQSGASWSFTCPECQVVSIKECDNEMLSLLVGNGVEFATLENLADQIVAVAAGRGGRARLSSAEVERWCERAAVPGAFDAALSTLLAQD